MKLSDVTGFLSLSLLFHLIYIMSIFDIYFRSPLEREGLEEIAAASPAPAKRLVLFVGDGLRADKCFEHDEEGHPRAPFLRRLAREFGAWGVSHTRVPTESRPGHVAMIAGFYEDPSAVTKGWKKNPVDYDHLLRRARHAWSFGAPEIVDLFLGENVNSQHYAEEMIDFGKDALELDKWSFDRLRELFELASLDGNVDEKLRSDGNIIFVHLLGLDTNGHAHGPHSNEYLGNVAYVDQGVQRAVTMIDNFYNDNQTAYVFTSDHGMSNAGTHGDGDPDNTRCPLVIWGAGASSPITKLGQYEDEEYTSNWKLGDIERRDINQADLTPLMATLIGIPIPINSVGKLPVEHLGTSKEHKAKATLVNMRQLAQILKVKEMKRYSQEPFFKPFSPSSSQVQDILDNVEGLLAEEEFDHANAILSTLHVSIDDGIVYYQKYDWLLLRSVVALGYVSWIIYSLTYLICFNLGRDSVKKYPFIRSVAGIFFAMTAAFLYFKKSPSQYYFYFGFPILLSTFTAECFAIHGREIVSSLGSGKMILTVTTYMLGLQVLAISFFYQSALSFLIPTVALQSVSLLAIPGKILLYLMLSAAAIFPVMEPIKKADNVLLYSGISVVLVAILYLYNMTRRKSIISRFSLVIAAAFLIWNADAQFLGKHGLSPLLQVPTWLILLFSLTTPFLRYRNQTPFNRLVDIFIDFAPAYIILSVSYEVLFYLCYSVPFLVWVASYPSIPSKRITTQKKSLDPKMLFMAFKLITYIFLGFFGTGNFASISSFALPSVYRLITIFSPFIMATLLIAKILIPIFFLSAAFGIICRLQNLSSLPIFLLLMGTVDAMTLTFFFLVRDYGSWLEIGTSISHFVIVSVFGLVVMLVLGVSNILLRGVTYI